MHDSKMAAAMALALSLPTLALAGEHEHDHRQHDAHVHGAATLMLALEGSEFHIGLNSPAMNIIGFEHRPKDAGQREQAQQAREILQQGATLFVINPEAECQFKEASAHSDLFETGEHDEHGHDEHGHEEPEHAEQDHGDPEERHADIEAEYRFACAQPDALQELRVGLFDAFPGTQQIQAMFVTDQGQGAVQLTPDTRIITF